MIIKLIIWCLSSIGACTVIIILIGVILWGIEVFKRNRIRRCQICGTRCRKKDHYCKECGCKLRGDAK